MTKSGQGRIETLRRLPIRPGPGTDAKKAAPPTAAHRQQAAMFLLRPAMSAWVLSSAGEPDTLAAQPETGDSLAHIRADRQLNKLLIRHTQ
jgi:hypothetical protein